MPKAKQAKKQPLKAEPVFIDPLCSCSRQSFVHVRTDKCENWIYSFFREPEVKRVKVKFI